MELKSLTGKLLVVCLPPSSNILLRAAAKGSVVCETIGTVKINTLSEAGHSTSLGKFKSNETRIPGDRKSGFLTMPCGSHIRAIQHLNHSSHLILFRLISSQLLSSHLIVSVLVVAVASAKGLFSCASLSK